MAAFTPADEIHKLITTYTEINRQTTAGTAEYSSVTTLDGHQIDYYDSEKKQNLLKWEIPEYTESREKHQQIYRKNSHVIMAALNRSDGVHELQRMYGCVWDDGTGDSHGLDRYAYNGEDFISLDLKENRYIASVPQAKPIVEKLNNDTAQLGYLKEYNDYKCVYLLKDSLYFSKKELPLNVSLKQKNSIRRNYNVVCYTSTPRRKNGRALSNSSGLVKSGDTLQRAVDQWKMNNCTCVVEHKSLPETIPTILTEDQSTPGSDASYIMYLAPAIIPVTAVLFVLWKLWKKLKASSKKKTTIKSKTKPSQEPAPAQDSQESLLSTDLKDLESGSLLFLHGDAENPFPEASPSQFLTSDRSSQLHPTTES